MPGSARALRITDAYRARLGRLAQLAAQTPWTVTARDLDESGVAWAAAAAARLTVLQGAGAQLAAGYVAAYVAAETGQPPTAPAVDDTAVGGADDGRPLTIALATALIAVKVALKRGRDEHDALRFGQDRAQRIIATATAAAPRAALATAINTDEHVIGWRRVTRGGCGACLAAANNTVQQGALKVHPHCECTAEPVIAGVRDTVLRPSGRDIFNSWPQERQDALLGPEKATLIRSGEIPFERLIAPQPMAIAPDGLTEAPLAALT